MEVLSADVVLVGVEPALKSKRYNFPLKRMKCSPLTVKIPQKMTACPLVCCWYIHVCVFVCGFFSAVKIYRRSSSDGRAPNF